MQIRKHIPNAITSMNLLCGVLGVIFTLLFPGGVKIGFILMLAASVFDFLDGFAARKLGAYSDMGKELDSLCDMVSFGVLPSVMMVMTMATKRGETSWICFIPVVLAIFSALRLAKFNIDTRQKETFVGLATPSAAMLSGSLCYYVSAVPYSNLSFLSGTVWFIPLLAVILSALLVSEVPMFSLKASYPKGSAAHMGRISFFSISAIAAVMVVALGLNWSLIVTMVFAAYILINLVFHAFPSTRGLGLE
ncbi:MAG: CDP-diacylglycerol--serine O-phosphatidyltransferase [Bacteroidales bacterium]|nr:CDP-diacylglycerol--serine O-phosphatidyltransferase [Bacteroidales bacterium]